MNRQRLGIFGRHTATKTTSPKTIGLVGSSATTSQAVQNNHVHKKAIKSESHVELPDKNVQGGMYNNRGMEYPAM